MPREYRVGDWIVRPELHRVTRGETEVRLEPKVMQVLEVLAERPGELVTREQLLERVWPDTFVSDDALHRAIRELRRAFGESAQEPAVVETIRKRGYRLIAPVASVEPVAPAAPAAPVAVAREPRQSPRSFLLIAAGLVLVVAGAVVAASFRPDPATPAGAVRFVSLTAGPENEFDPALDASGRLVYAAEPAGVTGGGPVDLYLIDAPGAPPRRLTNNPADDRMASWNPDATAIAFVRQTPAACDVLVMVVETGAERHVMPCANPFEPMASWSADGRWLVHSLAPDPARARDWQIARTAIATGVREPLTLPPAGTLGDYAPAVSADGRHVAFIRQIGGGVADVFVAPFGGGPARRVTTEDGDIAGLTWTDDDRAIVYSSDRAGGYSLWRVPAEGGESTLVAGGAAKLKHPHAAGGRIAYEAWAYEINVWRVDLADGAARPVAPTSDLWNYHPRPSPDDTRLAFVSTRSGATEVWLVDSDGGAPRQLTRFGRASLRSPRWSPDGTRLIVPALIGGHADLYAIDAASGETRQVTFDPGDEVAPAWSGDGAAIYYGARRDGVWRVMRAAMSCLLDPAGVDETACESVAIEGGYAAVESPDGRALYFTRADGDGLWRRAIDGGVAERILPGTPAGSWSTWDVTPAGIFYLARAADGGAGLRRADLDGAGVREVARLGDLGWSGIAVTADGGTAFVARADRRESNLAAVEGRPGG